MTDVLLSSAPVDLADRPGQHSSHRGLLNAEVVPSDRKKIDAVLVPAARDSGRLEPAARLAAELGCPLIALCSWDADPRKIRSADWGTTVFGVDVRPKTPLPDLLTTALLSDSRFARRSDTSLKRNLGLALTRLTGWEHVLFLDDDITKLDADLLERAASLLGAFGTVGLENIGYPDNSVVCHANRDTGSPQSAFVGAGALLFPGSRATSFFPDVYNEDWFFLLDSEQLVDVAVHGTFSQAQYDPYANPKRAGDEEFGDCLAEGLFALLDDGAQLGDADHRYWRRFLDQRRRLIEEIIGRARHRPREPARRARILASMNAARDSLADVSASLCVAYLDAWRRDRERWADYVNGLDARLTPVEALTHLGLAG
jgi:hypothetical protein